VAIRAWEVAVNDPVGTPSFFAQLGGTDSSTAVVVDV